MKRVIVALLLIATFCIGVSKLFSRTQCGYNATGLPGVTDVCTSRDLTFYGAYPTSSTCVVLWPYVGYCFATLRITCMNDFGGLNYYSLDIDFYDPWCEY